MSGKSGNNTTTIADAGGGGEGETTGNSEGGGTTMALQKKRLRRVSFAEMTSVHFFDRDEEDNETPKEGQSAVKDGNGSAEKDDILGFLQFEDSKGEEEGEERQEGEDAESDDEELTAMRRPFLRPIESPSPGSGFGSATSNDEDFFGPVSSSFIRPNRLSDSGASDDNHDVTMDSTAFSMHFRSLARSESGVDLKTPTGVHLSFEEKTSAQPNAGSSMELTLPKKLLSISSSPTGKRSGNSNSSDMSLVGDSPSKYDYGRLSPGLDALLAEGSKNLSVISDSNNIVALESPRDLGNVFCPPRENLSGFMDDTNNGKVVCSLHEESGRAKIHRDRSHEFASAEFISSPAKQRETFLSTASPLKNMSVMTPQERGSSQHKEGMKNYESASLIQKSISKLKLLEASPFSASLTSKIESLNIKPEFSKSSPFKILLGREMDSFQPKHLDASSRSTDSQVLIASPKKGAQINDSSTDNSNTQDPLDRELVHLTKESNAEGVSPAQFIVGKKLTGTPEWLVRSPEKWSQKKLTASPEHQNSDVFVPHDHFVNLQNSDLKGNTIDVDLSTAPFERLNPFYVGTRVDFGSPVVKDPASNLHEVSAKDDRNNSVLDIDKHGGSEMIENLGTPTKENGSHLTQTTKVDGGLQAGTHLSVCSSNLPWGEPESATSSSVVPSVHRCHLESTFQENAVDSLPQSASKKEFQIIGREQIDMHYTVDVSALTSNQLKSPRKRRSEVLALDDSEHQNEVAIQQRNPKLHKVVGHDNLTLGGPNEDCGETITLAHGLKHWTDIHSKFSAERLVPSSIDKLNFSVVDSLEDVLFNLKMSKTYGILCNEIFPQKTSVCNDLRSERVGEIRLRLHQIMHEKAKLQLMCAKKKMLLGKLPLLRSGVQEIQTLKMNFLPKFMGGTQAALQNFNSIWQRDEDACDKVTAMEQALEALNKKKVNFIKALQSFCKIKGEPSCSDCILLSNGHLTRKSCRRLIRLGMQIWTVEDVKSMDNLHDVSLNYLDIIIQSFKFTGCPASSIVISNKLDDVNIMKNFPNMDVCKAFSFVLNAETTQKYIGSKCLARETQVTSSLIGNLVDVVRELQLARMELRSLTQSTFHCPLAGQLNLHLCFFCLKRGKKVSLILDMSCLTRGIYPSEILPAQVTASFGRNNALVEPIADEIIDAVKNTRAGYMRILRLCRCISQVVQGSSNQIIHL